MKESPYSAHVELHPRFKKGAWICWSTDVRDTEPEKIARYGPGPFRVRAIHGYRRCSCSAGQFEERKTKHSKTCPGRRYRLSGIHSQLVSLEDEHGRPVPPKPERWLSATNFIHSGPPRQPRLIKRTPLD